MAYIVDRKQTYLHDGSMICYISKIDNAKVDLVIDVLCNILPIHITKHISTNKDKKHEDSGNYSYLYYILDISSFEKFNHDIERDIKKIDKKIIMEAKKYYKKKEKKNYSILIRTDEETCAHTLTGRIQNDVGIHDPSVVSCEGRGWEGKGYRFYINVSTYRECCVLMYVFQQDERYKGIEVVDDENIYVYEKCISIVKDMSDREEILTIEMLLSALDDNTTVAEWRIKDMIMSGGTEGYIIMDYSGDIDENKYKLSYNEDDEGLDWQSLGQKNQKAVFVDSAPVDFCNDVCNVEEQAISLQDTIQPSIKDHAADLNKEYHEESAQEIDKDLEESAQDIDKGLEESAQEIDKGLEDAKQHDDAGFDRMAASYYSNDLSRTTYAEPLYMPPPDCQVTEDVTVQYPLSTCMDGVLGASCVYTLDGSSNIGIKYSFLVYIVLYFTYTVL